MNWLIAALLLLGGGAAGVGLTRLGDALRGRRGARRQAALESSRINTVTQVLHLATQGAPTGVTVLDRDGDVALSNAKAHEMGIIHDRSVHPDVWRAAQEVFGDQETRVMDLPTPVRRTGSRVLSVRAVVKPLTLVDDRFVIVYSSDESENTRMESARRDFVANVSHELKTPVGGMALLAEAVLEAKEDPEQVEYFADRLHREALRMSDLVNELISLSKLQGAEALPEMAPVSVDEIIDEAIARNQIAADSKNITLTRGRASGTRVNGDRSLLLTAVSNLVSNAINYSGESVPVSLSQKVVGDAAVQIRVTDRGIGIAPEHQDRVFERFFRVDKARSRSTGGTGLGLAIVKHVVANHGGSVTLWSKVGIGSTFTIELPLLGPHTGGERDAAEDAEQQGPIRKAVSRVSPRRKERN